MIPQGGSSSTGSPSCSSSSSSGVSAIVGGQEQQQQQQQNASQGHRWMELRNDVRSIRNRLSCFDKKVPSMFTFRTVHCKETGRSKVRLYFLSAARSGGETTLMFADLPDAAANDVPNSKTIPRYPLIEPSFKAQSAVSLGSSSSSDGSTGVPSREEQLQRERKRLVTWGISMYDLHLDSGTFIFPACGSLFTLKDSGLMTDAQYPSQVKISSRGERLNPLVCPWNPDVIAYVCNGDIWVQHIESAHAMRLTHVHKGSKSIADDPLQAGMPAYVLQEEFRRYVGFWWQPKCTDGMYRILYEEVDESEVEILHFISHDSEDKVIQEFRYPRAGTANAKSTLKMLQFQLHADTQKSTARTHHLKQDLDVLCPWMEYLVRIGWTPDGKNVWIQCLDRRQCRLEIILIPLSDFIDENTIPFFSASMFSEATKLIEETNSTWINVHDILYFLPSTSNDDSLSFVWADERTGFRRLLLVTVGRDEEAALVAAAAANHVSNTAAGTSGNVTNGERHYKLNVIKEVALTDGEWEVLNNKIFVDEKRQIVYFTGMRHGPLEKHLYAVSLNSPLDVRQITANGHSHTVTLNKECDRFVTVYSSISTLTTCEVFAMKYPENELSVQKLTISSLGFLLKQSDPEKIYCSPKLFVYEPPDQREPLYCMIYTPPNMKPCVKYPTVLYVYGGPEMQMVNNSFKGMRYMRLHMLAAQGYVVVVVDSRGSCHRGVKFESYIKGRMGTVEISDQVEALEWLAEKTGHVDMSRVAIHGWSYGGYLSLMGLAQRPDIFKIAIAGAPVTSWLLYDTAYTERYMDLPSLNSQGYATGNVLCYVHTFPYEANRLVIIHGLIDENVHFQHTSQLISALVKAGKPYHLQIYPSERHSLRHLDSSEHYEVSLLSFLEQHL